MIEYCFKDNYDFNDLVEIIKILRAPGGCPWDSVQTHASIKKDFIEETYEVIEAINKNDSELLCEELGDVLLQVVFHAEISNSEGQFNINDVCDGVCKKLIERHPHVFGDVKVDSVENVLDNWDSIKRRSKAQPTQGSAMQKVPRELPALMRAQKIQQKAKKAGFDWPEIDGCYDALGSEIIELKEAAESDDKDKIIDEMGDVLFSCVNISRFLKVDAEEALTASTDKFMKRFLIVEKLAGEKGIDMNNATLEELDALWEIAKQSN